MTNDPTKAGANLPVIDMAPLFDRDGTAARTEVARAIQAACRDSGFFYVTGHGVPFVNAYRTLAGRLIAQLGIFWKKLESLAWAKARSDRESAQTS